MIDTTKDYWTMRDGTKIKYVDMTDTHIHNCIKMIHRRIDETKVLEQKELDQFPVFDILDSNAEVQLMISESYKKNYEYFNNELRLLEIELVRRGSDLLDTCIMQLQQKTKQTSLKKD